jgi:3-dehydroquinate synthase
VFVTHEIRGADGRRCEVRVGRGNGTADSLVLPGTGRVAVLTQPAVTATAERIVSEAAQDGAGAAMLVLPDGEAAKNLATVEQVYEWLNSLGFTRGDMLIGIGGGALTDLSGFVAATYLRGVEVTYLPTTLLGAVDASIGGKTGVNVGGKNLAGVFRHPRRVVVDLDLLDALPERLLREGAAETVKAGFIADEAILTEYETRGIEASLDIVVPAAIKVKVDTVIADFTEQGLRAILNYGHTIGHAVEVAAAIPHGEAVAIGMVAAGRISELLLGFSEAQRQTEIIERIGLPIRSPGVDAAEIAMLMNRDKKRDEGGIRMVLLESFGSPVVRHVDTETIQAGLAEVGAS